ncbi:ABC transporter ATP-binding protein [Senegalimassilia anaerobia]|uniref:ABC transporter ATP-binding protein n=1 Tax=Senegalimassilia anaerobia TaxID=1473216 RepID=UPI002E79DF40|nr:ABC transporter ATP-binding protein [Senegalimassilia anaerobia]MEE0226984.1 ABC transporter ATP-binding protein [Senegalimassilia anaerobia]
MMRGAEAREQDEVTYAWLFAQSKAQHGRIVALSVLCTVQAAVLVSFALACRAVIDQAVAGIIDGLLSSAVVLAGVIIAQLVLRLAINSTQERIRARFALELRKSILDSIFAARFGNVLRFHSGELSNRMFSDVQVVSNGVATIIPSFVSMLMQLVFAIAVLALISPPMVALFAAAALLSFVLARTLRGRLKALHKTVQEKEGAVRVFLQEALEHQLVIRSFGAQPATSARADTLQEDHFTAQMRRRGYSIAANASFSFFFNALYAVALTWCAFELLHGAMSYGTLMAVLQLVARIQAPVSSLSGMLPQLYQTLASAERLMEVAELPHSEGCLPVTAEEFYQRLSGVRMRNLAFSYDDEEAEDGPACAEEEKAKGASTPIGGAREEDGAVSPDGPDTVENAPNRCVEVIDSPYDAGEAEGGVASAGGMETPSGEEPVSLTCADVFVPKGSFVVVEGPSGSGKSTLFKLLLGAYDANGFSYELAASAAGAMSVAAAPDAPAGSVAMGAPLTDAPASAFAVSFCSASQVPPGAFAYVPQDNFLFAGSIRENVAFAASDATNDQVKRACEVACAWGFVEELPLGLDTMIGEHGQGLSQGQLQRLAIARAVCSGAPVMVLDEVTSALDDATEAAVLANIASLPGKTIFVAAHRAKAREFATMRLHVEDGVLTEAR